MYKQGDIVLIPVPFSDLSSNKKRPVLIISSNTYNSLTDDIIVVAVTSNITNKKYCVDIEETDIFEGQLPAKSQVRADKIYTLAQSIIIKKIGCVTKEFVNITVNSMIEIFIELPK